MTLVAGVDCSTQNTKVVVCDTVTGEVVREGRAPHPDVTEVEARDWWQAWEQASAGLLEGVEAVAVGGQQHGMVLVDEAGTPVAGVPPTVAESEPNWASALRSSNSSVSVAVVTRRS